MRAPAFPLILPMLAASLLLHGAVGGGLWLLVATRRAPVVTHAASPPQLTGDTLEAPEREDEAESADETTAEAPSSPTTASQGGIAPASTARGTRPRDRTMAKVTTATSAGGAGAPEPPRLYGAVGARAAVDLATSFTTAFPQAASGDPEWGRIALGSAGEATVSLDIDESGRFQNLTIEGTPSNALRAGITRTMALISGRPFTSHGSRTKLRLRAVVSKDDAHDGWHGDAFALSGAGHFSGSSGSAFFALPIGRRIDLDVRLAP